LYESRINSELEILRILLEKNHEIRFWNRIQGFGLSEAEFEKYSKNCSRRVFGYRKEELKDKKLICPLRTKGKRTKYFSITPLGIIKLLRGMKSINTSQIKQICKVLNFFKFKSHGKNHFDMKQFIKFLNKIDEKIVYQCLKAVINRLKIEEDDDFTAVYSIENLPVIGSIIRFRYLIHNKKIYRSYDISNPYQLNKATKVEDEGFYHGIGTILIDSFHIELYKKLKYKGIPDFYKAEMYEHIQMNQSTLLKTLNVEQDKVFEIVEKIEDEFV